MKMELNNIQNKSIFGEYKQKENRITSAVLHILKLGGEPLINFILLKAGNQLPDSEILVQTQVKASETVPDGVLSCNFNFKILIESKIRPNEINKKQLEGHRKYLKNNRFSENDKLIYITPDNKKPAIFEDSEIWFNWGKIVEILKEYLNLENNSTDTELLKFLIEQFELLIENENLVDYSENRVIVVGGIWGEEIAMKFNFYACQNNRFFKPSRYLTFAFNNRIQYLFKIVDQGKNDINLRDEKKINEKYFEEYDVNYKNEKRELFYLEFVQEFVPPIENDNIDKNGKRCAYVQRQTYTTYDKILKATKTSEL